MSPRPRDPSAPYYRLTALCGAAFAVTVFAFIVASFGEPDSSLNRVFDVYGTRLILAEIGILFAIGGTAMAVDRRRGHWRGIEESTPRSPAAETPGTGQKIPNEHRISENA